MKKEEQGQGTFRARWPWHIKDKLGTRCVLHIQLKDDLIGKWGRGLRGGFSSASVTWVLMMVVAGMSACVVWRLAFWNHGYSTGLLTNAVCSGVLGLCWLNSTRERPTSAEKNTLVTWLKLLMFKCFWAKVKMQNKPSNGWHLWVLLHTSLATNLTYCF